MVLHVPNTFIQTKISPKKDSEDWVIIRIKGMLVDMLVEMDSETYRKNVVFETGRKLIYVVVLVSIYVMITAELLFYNKFHGDLENI